LPILLKYNALQEEYEFILSRDAEVFGIQLSFNTADIELNGRALPMDQSCVSLDAEGYSRISWGQKDAIRLRENDVLFTINSATASGNLTDLLMKDEDGLFPEIYTEGLGNQMVELVPFSAAAQSATFETAVNPNPFTDNTTLRVTLPVGSDFEVTVYDVKGQELIRRNYSSTQATTDVNLGPEQIRTTGIYYYRVVSDLGELSGKFIRQ
jgi:hypothetical protein